MNRGVTQIFRTKPGFCENCGSILPLLRETGNITCYSCATEYPTDVFGTSTVKYTMNFNSAEAVAKNTDDRKRQKEEQGDEGPTVDRKCPKCGNDKFSYATVQLRSADEGQTVFYTCTKCKHKEAENS